MQSLKPRVIGYIPLHYGKEYLAYAIKSMEPWVEKIYIVYTPVGSHGHHSNSTCPETEEMLQKIAHEASPKVIWHKGTWHGESAHRKWIYSEAEGFDMVLTCDADEIIDQDDIGPAIEEAFKSDKRHIGIDGFINFWRSFNHVCLDGFRPIRMINLRNRDGEMHVKCRFYHFGYCQSMEISDYKWEVSGHKPELRRLWHQEVYRAWNPGNNFGDLHPVARGLWNTVPFDRNLLPQMLHSHPNFNKDIVE